ncbi:MAG: hypothetical protein WDZ76_01500 [Pseudohongiellaceae bacterium]
MELIDNINRLLGDDIKQTLKAGARLHIAAPCFSMYAFEALKAELEQIGELRFTACFDADGKIDGDFVKELAKTQPLRAVFHDASFKDDATGINVEQIFTQLSPATEVKCL